MVNFNILNASSVSYYSAVLNATVEPITMSVSYRFWYKKKNSVFPFVSTTLRWTSYSISPSEYIFGLTPNTTYQFYIQVGNQNSAIREFTTLGAPITINTTSASSISTNSARLNGTLDTSTSVSTFFRYRRQGVTSWTSTVPVTYSSGISFFRDVSGLLPNTTYEFVACYSLNNVVTTGSILTFTTLSDVSVTTLSDVDVSATTARVRASFSTNVSTQVFFRYKRINETSWTETAYSTFTDSSSTTRLLSGLQSGTTYEFRAGIRAGGNTYLGVIRSFTTNQEIIDPSVSLTTQSASNIGINSVTLSCSVTTNIPIQVRFRYRVTAGTWNYTSYSSISSSRILNRNVSGLLANQAYQFEAESEYAVGGVLSFTTLPDTLTSNKSLPSYTEIYTTEAETRYTTISNCFSTGTITSTGVKVGGLVGENSSRVINCATDMTVTSTDNTGGLVGINYKDIDSSYSLSTVTGSTNVGGLVGNNEGEIEDCYVKIEVEGEDNVGGFVGNNTGTITKSYSKGNVDGTVEYVGGFVGYNNNIIYNCYSMAIVEGEDNVGGFVGYNFTSGDIEFVYSIGKVTCDNTLGGLSSLNTGTIANSYWDVDKSGVLISDGGDGKSTTLLHLYTLYSNDGWNIQYNTSHIDEAWSINNGKNYPKLSFTTRPTVSITYPEFEEDFSISLWIYVNENNSDTIILSNQYEDVSNYIEILSNDDELKFNFVKNDVDSIITVSDIEKTAWSHVLLSRNIDGTIRIFINDVEEVDEYNANVENTNFGIKNFSREWIVGKGFKGIIDEISFFDYDIRDIEVSLVYNSGDGISFSNYNTVYKFLQLGHDGDSFFRGFVSDFRIYNKYLTEDERASIYSHGYGTTSSLDLSDTDVIQGVNLLNVRDFSKDTTNISNRVRVYGETIGNNIINLQTVNDTESQSQYWIKDRVLNEQNISDRQELLDKADIELQKLSVASFGGSISAINLLGTEPGQMIHVAVPNCKLNSEYKIQSITHRLSSPISTDVSVSKKTDKIDDLFIGRYNVDDMVNPSNNINNMNGSYTVNFLEDPSVMFNINTIERDGRLQLQPEQTTGVATSAIIDVGYNITKCEFRRFENYHTDNDVYEVTNDGGTTWETVDRTTGALHTFSSTGSSLAFRIQMMRETETSPSPMYEAICVLYK